VLLSVFNYRLIVRLVLFFALLFCAMGISFALAKATASTTLATTMAVDNFAPQSVINKRTLLYEPTNTAPTLDAIADPAPIDQDAAIQMVNLTGITAGGSETQTLTVTATSANSALVPHPAVTYTSPDTTGSLRYTPVTGASGSTVITVTVDDGQAISATTTQTFTVVVKPATVYVSPTFTDTAGTSIPDADLGLAGDQAATQASTAFATINAALAAAATNGTIIVNGGSYSETVTLNTSQTLKISGADVNQTVILSDLSTSAAVTVTIDGASTLTFGDEDNRTLAGLISGSGNLVKQGSGMATLANSNTYSGLTTVNAGTLRVTVNAALGSPASGTTVASGATLDLRNVTYSTAESLTLGGGALSNSGVSTTTFAGAVTMTANSNFGTGNSGSSLLILNGVVTGNFVLNKRNAGTLRLLNTSNSFRSFIIAGGVVPVFYVYLIAAAMLIALALWGILTFSRIGKIIRAAAQNPTMTSALGINTSLIYAAVFAFGGVLAGLAGGLAAPVRSMSPGMGFSILIESFIVTVIGGMGSVSGALVGALLIGLIRSFGTIGFPLFVEGLMFLAMVLILILRPNGLLGKESRA
jgi:autotransporter-associated beta strand protein